jgi:SecD/SecF fusion protein
MTRPSVVRAILALAILVASAYYAITDEPKMGLDLRGGTQIVLEAQDTDAVKADSAATDRALEVLRRRVDALGVSEPTLTRSGSNRIIVELPDVQNPQQAADLLGRTAQLTMHPVLGIEGAQTPATPAPGETEKAPATAEATPAATSPAHGPQEAGGTATTPAATPEASGAATPAAEPTKNAAGELVLPDESGQQLRLGDTKLTGAGISGADALFDTQNLGGWAVTVNFTGTGRKAWEELTGQAACAPDGDPTRRVAIVLDNRVISSPQVDPSVQCNVGITGGSTQITGSFTGEQAKDLAALIKGGALPVPVKVVEQRTVGPTLGEKAINASAKAAIIGIILTALFITVIYRLMGGLATVALACYALISYAALVALGATLTLPGLAGFVLAIGMAVDANVLVFERAREEYDEGTTQRLAKGPDRRTGKAPTGRGLKSALTLGFKGAWSAIIDSNVTTLLAAALLFFLASGTVRGFGVTLSIGVIASMVSALIITRVLAEFAVDRNWVKKRPHVTGIAHLGRAREWLMRRNPNLMGRSRRWIALSALLIAISAIGIGVRGLDFGIEFTGGRLIEYSTSKPVNVNEAREVVADAGFPRAVVNESGDNDISIRTEEMTNAEEEKLASSLKSIGGTVEKKRDELIGPSIGSELRRNALIALGIALLAQLAYLAFRFRWTFAVSAVIAMFHDVVVVTGVFAWLGKPIDGVFLAALLTVIGYSVNDTVVVFDRVRELRHMRPKEPFAVGANTALLQTFPRTINTGLGAIFILAALAVLGGDTLTDFGIALLLGIIVGTFSSVFTATPLAIELDRRNPATPTRTRTSSGRPTKQRAQDSSGAVV